MPAPAEPIEFRVLEDLREALRGIRVVEGYHTDVADNAVRFDSDSDVEEMIEPNGPRPLVIVQPDSIRREYFPGEQTRIVLPVTLHWISRSVATDDDSRQRTFFRGCADVEQAIAVDVTRGALAVDTRIVNAQLDLTKDGTQVWALIDLEISLHRTYGQPNG